ncbi:sigma-70 family RNA polymerase sigma factor [Salipaludibacillus sp. CF4.18]|uniref:sigma-70 family RNA polymerase sigma factor n=1 Tax=Salipaludibacillus sp. CF4.18 TaxID=3373081 RepID=UPI003EE736C2
MDELDRNDLVLLGDKDLWLEGIMDQYGERLTKLAYNYVKDWGIAEDVVQDVFITCYKQFDEIDKVISFKAWIFRMTINKCKDVLKSSFIKKIVFNKGIFDRLSSSVLSPEGLTIKRNEEEVLSKCILSLPIKYREIIILYYYEDLSVLEISVMLKMNGNTIKTRLNRGRDRLKIKLERGRI